MHAATLTALALLTALLAGCTDGADEETTLVIDLPDGETIEAGFPFDADARPTADRYAADGATHPDFYSAFDQLEDAAQRGLLEYEATYFADFGSYVLDSIDGVAPEDGFWALYHNDAMAQVGMGDLRLSVGDEVHWKVEAFEGSSGGSVVVLDVDPVAVTRNATATLEGAVDRTATVTIVLDDGNVTATVATFEADGAWGQDVELPYGQSILRVAADDGASTVTASVPAVRLAETTVQVRFNQFAPEQEDRDDTVWIDLDARASAPMYDDVSSEHPDHANVHDHLVTWEDQTGISIDYSHSDSFGYGVERIDGAGNPVTSDAPPWWCYTVNGSAEDVLGITLQELRPGDVVLWDLGDCGVVPT